MTAAPSQANLGLGILRELQARARMAAIIEAHFERTDDPKDRVRCSAVYAAVARELDTQVAARFCRRVLHAAEWVGWRRIVTVDNVRYFCRMVPR
jgi:hypothetical protein